MAEVSDLEKICEDIASAPDGKVFSKKRSLFKKLLDSYVECRKQPEFDYTKYLIVEDAHRGRGDGKIISMKPDEFLHYAPAVGKEIYLHPPAIVDKVKEILETGKIKVGYLMVTGNKVTSHEGRHTMAAAKILGIDDIPVLIYGDHQKFNRWTRPQYQ